MRSPTRFLLAAALACGGLVVAAAPLTGTATAMPLPDDASAAAAPRTGGLVGTLTDGATGRPVPRARVVVENPLIGAVVADAGRTTANGRWSATHLEPGTYVVHFADPARDPGEQWARGELNPGSADPVTVTAGSSTRVDDRWLPPPSGTIAGTVTATASGARGAGRPLGNVCVDVYQPRGAEPVPGGSACTDDAGRYVVDGLVAGRYQVHFVDQTGEHADEWARDQPTRATASLLSVPLAGRVTADAALRPGGRLTGVIRDRQSGAPVAGATATVYAGRTDEVLGFGTTDAHGAFMAIGLPATGVTVQITPGDGVHLPRWYGSGTGAEGQAQARPVRVAGAGTTRLAETAVDSGGQISGLVTDAGTGDGIPDVCVGVGPYDTQAQAFPDDRSACTDGSGHYVITGLPAGHYAVEFVPDPGSSYAFQWYPERGSRADATLVTVVAGRRRAGVNAPLAPGGTVAGRLVRTDGQPTPTSVLLGAYDARTGDLVGYPTDSLDERWAVTNLPTTGITLKFEDSAGSSPARWYADRPDPASADVVAATAGRTVDGLAERVGR